MPIEGEQLLAVGGVPQLDCMITTPVSVLFLASVGACVLTAGDDGSVSLARPKSSTFAMPSRRTITFSGLMSR